MTAGFSQLTAATLSLRQDGCVVHVAKDNVGKVVLPTVVGERVTVAHGATLHACTLQDDSFVGMGATVMDGAVVETGAMVAAGSLVTAGTVVPAGQVTHLLRVASPVAEMRLLGKVHGGLFIRSGCTSVR
jgi:carbonic anhydrase/acetyltransferase-like protein (isoleucine patch superfamily)